MTSARRKRRINRDARYIEQLSGEFNAKKSAFPHRGHSRGMKTRYVIMGRVLILVRGLLLNRKVLFGLAGVFLLIGAWAGTALAARTILVFPFENNTKNPTMEWIGDSFVETLNDQLASSMLTPVSLEQRNAAYDLLGLPYDGDFSHATLIKVGDELDANYAVIGNYRLDNGVFSVKAQLVSLDQPRIEAEFTEKGPLDSLKRIQSRLAWRILTHFDPLFPSSQDDFFKQFGEVPLSAFEYYVRGRRALDSRSQLLYFLKAERLFPNYSKAIFQIGKIYFQQKDYATSLLWLRRLTKTDPHYYEATFYLGLDDYFMNNFEKAASAFTLLSHEIPLNEVYNNLGAALSRMNNSGQATHDFIKAVEGDPGEPDFYFNLGYCYWKSKDYASAAKFLQEVVHLNPQDSEAYFLLANALQSLKQEDESAKYESLALKVNPKAASWTASSLPPLERVKLNYDAEAFRELKATLDQLQEEKLKNRPVAVQVTDHLNRAVEFYRSQQDEEARREFEAALSLNPKLSEAHYYLGLIQERRGKFDRAIEEFQTSLRITDSAKSHLALAHLYYTLDRRSEAEREVAAAQTLEPNNPEAKELEALLHQNASVTKK